MYAAPAYYVFKLYAGADAANPIAVTTKAGSYSVLKGVNRLPEIASVPYLDVVGALSQDGRTLTLFCVNRSLSTDIPTTIHLHDFSAAETATVHVLTSASLTDANDEMTPSRVIPKDSAEAVQPGGWTHSFPHASVTVISLNRR